MPPSSEGLLVFWVFLSGNLHGQENYKDRFTNTATLAAFIELT